MKSPLISVILPVYNVEQYLSQCLDSLISQTFENFEVICVNDGSTDASPEILEKYATEDERIRVFHLSNGGVSKARNYGYSRISKESEYVAVVDSDDVCRAERFKIQVDYLVKHFDVDILGGWMNMIGEGEGIVKVPLNHEEVKETLLYRCSICHPTVMIRRSFLDEAQLIYDTEITVCHDYDLWVKAAYGYNAKTVNLREVLVDYRIHQSQTTKRKTLMENEAQLIAKSARFRFLHGESKSSFWLGEFLLACKYHFERFVKFLYLRKTTGSGRLIIKVCKIPVVYKKLKKR